MTQQNPPRQANFKIYIGSILFFIYIFTSFPLIGTIILICFAAPFSIRYALARFWVSSIMWAAKVLCGITHEIEGLENLPEDRSAVVLSKHQSAWETLALRKLLPTQSVVLKESLLWIPFGGWALATLRPIAIDRDRQRESLKKLVTEGTQALKDGLWVVVFPEGTRTAVDENKKFNAGGAMLAQKAGVPVVPIAHNAGVVWPRYSFLKYPGVIKVKIGPVIEVEGKKAKEVNAEAERWIAAAMEEM